MTTQTKNIEQTEEGTYMHISTIDVTAKEWFDKVNGNSYFSARVIVNFQLPGQTEFAIPFQYGYDRHYQHITMLELIKRKIIPAMDTQRMPALWRYCNENNIILRADKHEKCLKRDVVSFGAN